MDASLKELTRLITEVYPNTKTKDTEFKFSAVWPNPRSSNFTMKAIGSTIIGTKGKDDTSTLQSQKFHIGDYLDVSINIARSGGHSNRDSRDNRRSSPSSNRRRR